MNRATDETGVATMGNEAPVQTVSPGRQRFPRGSTEHIALDHSSDLNVPTIASGALKKMLVTYRKLGLDPSQVLSAANVTPSIVDDADARVPLTTIHLLWEHLLAHKSIADVRFVGEPYAMGEYGMVGFVVMTSETLCEAIEAVVRYIGLWTDDPGFALDGSTLRAEYKHAFPDCDGVRMSTELAFAEILNGARLLTRAAIVPRAVRFAHPGPTDPSARTAYTSFFGCEVEFDASAHELVLTDSDLALSLPFADPQLKAFMRDAANRAIARREPDGCSLLERTRTLIAEEMARSVPTIETVARKLAVSERTLRRRLAEANTSFRELLDDTRAELARSYVRDRRMPLAEIAFMLGFSEPSTFHRAFKRWTQTTPAEWRARG